MAEKKEGKIKGFFREFKEFISRGNIVDLAVAVIIGGAFSAIVTALTNQIIMPVVNWVLALIVGKQGLEGAITMLSPAYDETKKLVLANSIYIDWGAFISAIINFIIIALTIFLIIKAINTSRRKLEELGDAVKTQNSKEYKEEKRLVKEKAQKEGISFKEAWKNHEEEKREVALKQEEEKKLQEEKQKQEEDLKRQKMSTEQLLNEIIVLLKEKK